MTDRHQNNNRRSSTGSSATNSITGSTIAIHGGSSRNSSEHSSPLGTHASSHSGTHANSHSGTHTVLPTMSSFERDDKVYFAHIEEGRAEFTFTAPDGSKRTYISDMPHRIITIAYRIYPERTLMNVEYAASIYRQDKPTETFRRKQHNQTARGRLEVRPLYSTIKLEERFIKNLLDREGLPKTKEDREKWRSSDEGREWKETRRELDSMITKFLRKEVGRHGTGNPTRMRRSDVSRARKAGLVPGGEATASQFGQGTREKLHEHARFFVVRNGSRKMVPLGEMMASVRL